MQTKALLVLAVFFSSTAHADSFDVQIGAFSNPNVAGIDLPTSAGELRKESGADGLTRYLVGPFFSRADADRARDELRAAGYDGAFVKTTPGTSEPAQQYVSTYEAEATDITSDADLSSYVQEEEGEVVTLDGRLHRKVGDRFIPLQD